MPERSWKMRLSDILIPIDRIQQYSDGLDFDQFRQDQKTVDAIIRNLEIIGEAANFVPVSIQDNHPEIPWTKMKGIGNIVAHMYFGVSLPIIWQTVQTDLTPLISPIKSALNEEPNQ